MPLIFTNGFYTHDDLLDHFGKHVLADNDFDVTTPNEYEDLADVFLGEELNTHTTFECYRVKRNGAVGDKIRYNTFTMEFGILSDTNNIRTYYKPKPNRHKQRTNVGYFNSECRRVTE